MVGVVQYGHGFKVNFIRVSDLLLVPRQVVQLLALCTQGVCFTLTKHANKFGRCLIPAFTYIHWHRMLATRWVFTPNTPLHGNAGLDRLVVKG